MFGEKVACASIFPHLQIQTWSYVTSVYISITISITLQSQSHTFCNMCTYRVIHYIVSSASIVIHYMICVHTLQMLCYLPVLSYIRYIMHVHTLQTTIFPASIVIHYTCVHVYKCSVICQCSRTLYMCYTCFCF